MICSVIILLSSFFLFPIHSFYIIDAGVLEQCPAKPITHLSQFDPTKMNCLDPAWRQVLFELAYSCFQNKLTRIWTIKTNANKNAIWPPAIYFITGKDYLEFDKTSTKYDLTIEEEESTAFDPNNNQLITYMWTSLQYGPRCRIQYTILKDVCATNKGNNAQFTDFVCYYGIQSFNLIVPDQRQKLSQLIDYNMPGGSDIPQNILSNGNNSQTNLDPSNLVPGALNANHIPLWVKYKRYIIIGGIIVVVIIIIAIVFIVMRPRESSDKDIERATSEDSNVE